MLPPEVLAGLSWLLSSVPAQAQPYRATNSDFVLALSSSSAPMTVAMRALTSTTSVGQKKAKNPFGLSDKAYKVADHIAHLRLQVVLVLAAA